MLKTISPIDLLPYYIQKIYKNESEVQHIKLNQDSLSLKQKEQLRSYYEHSNTIKNIKQN